MMIPEVTVRQVSSQAESRLPILYVDYINHGVIGLNRRFRLE
jgi:hypothetical protein